MTLTIHGGIPLRDHHLVFGALSRAKGCLCLFWLCLSLPSQGATASWYGEEHRGRLMANGERFNPDRFTAASWFYPIGTRVRVSRADGIQLSVQVIITDRGPERRFVRHGRVIDLSRAAFEKLEGLEMGLVAVKLSAVDMPAVRSGIDGKRRLVARVSAVGRERNDTPKPADHSTIGDRLIGDRTSGVGDVEYISVAPIR